MKLVDGFFMVYGLGVKPPQPRKVGRFFKKYHYEVLR